MSDFYYPFEFVGIDNSNVDDDQTGALVYRFCSAKSNHYYVVRVEKYLDNLHCVKFFDDTTSDVVSRFSRLTATYEPRTIFRTVVEIAFDVFRNNRQASFMYVGAADKKDLQNQPTRRYRVYRQYMSDFDLHEWFEPADSENYSLSVLTNIAAMPTVERRMAFLKKIQDFVGVISQ